MASPPRDERVPRVHIPPQHHRDKLCDEMETVNRAISHALKMMAFRTLEASDFNYYSEAVKNLTAARIQILTFKEVS